MDDSSSIAEDAKRNKKLFSIFKEFEFYKQETKREKISLITQKILLFNQIKILSLKEKELLNQINQIVLNY